MLGAPFLFLFVVTWNEFLFALSFASDKRVMTLPIGLSEFSLEFTIDWGALMAGSVLMTLPIVAITGIGHLERQGQSVDLPLQS